MTTPDEIYYLEDGEPRHTTHALWCLEQDIRCVSSAHTVSDTHNYLTLDEFQMIFFFEIQEQNPFLNYVLVSYADFALDCGVYGGNIGIPIQPGKLISSALMSMKASDFDIHMLTQVSSLDYEGDKCKAQIAFVPPEYEFELDIRLEMGITVTYQPDDAMAIRKLLQLTGDNLCLFMGYWSPRDIGPDGRVGIHKPFSMIGLGEYKINKHRVAYSATIHGYLNWTLFKEEYPVLKFVKGRYMFPAKEKTDTLAEKKKKLQKEMKTSAKLNKILDVAKNQKHGTTLVITKDAQREARRLCKAARGYAVKLDLTKNRDIINNITGIDGALILDCKGICYGIGVILDGHVCVSGDRARGARFNSAKNYIVDKQRDPNEQVDYAALVISMDGYVDLFTTKDKFDFLEPKADENMLDS